MPPATINTLQVRLITSVCSIMHTGTKADAILTCKLIAAWGFGESFELSYRVTEQSPGR